jgi:CelD/BcsL family acetyltransferase involved in cellulose biosynthesis
MAERVRQGYQLATVELHHSPAAFEDLAGEWNALVAGNPASPPFIRADWLALWWRLVGRGDLCILAVRDEDGALIGVAPLYCDGSGGQPVIRMVGYGPLFYMDISDYLDFAVAPGCEATVYAAVLDALTGARRGIEPPPWDRVELCNVGEWSPLPAGLEVHAAAWGLEVERAPLYVCPVIRLPDSWEAYLETLDSKQRREIKRKLRRASGENHTRWYVVGPEHDIEVEAAAFIQMMARSGKGKEEFLIPQMRQMFLEGMRVAQAGGWLQLAFLEVAGRKAAAYFNFDYHGRIWVFNSAIDADASAGISTGWVLLAHLIQAAIEDGRGYYDFLRGDEEYKLHFGGRPTHNYKLTLRRLGG